MPLTFQGIFILFRIVTSFLFPRPYPILIPANPNDLVNERKTKRLLYFFKYLTTDCLGSDSSMKHSSTKTKVDLFCDVTIIFCIFFLEIRIPVGLFGLHMNMHPFLGIFLIKVSRSWFRFIVLKNINLEPCSFAATSYSLNVGIGISTGVFLFRKA